MHISIDSSTSCHVKHMAHPAASIPYRHPYRNQTHRCIKPRPWCQFVYRKSKRLKRQRLLACEHRLLWQLASKWFQIYVIVSYELTNRGFNKLLISVDKVSQLSPPKPSKRFPKSTHNIPDKYPQPFQTAQGLLTFCRTLQVVPQSELGSSEPWMFFFSTVRIAMF